MGGTVSLRCPIPTFYDRRATVVQLSYIVNLAFNEYDEKYFREKRSVSWHVWNLLEPNTLIESFSQLLTFLHAIRLIVFLITEKLVKFYQQVFCFFELWFRIRLYDPFHTIIDNFYFVLKEFCCLRDLCPRIWNVLWMRFLKMNQQMER